MSIDAHREYAASLLADVLGASPALPRREELVEWLRDFLRETRREGYRTVPGTRDNLVAVHSHLLAFALDATPQGPH